MATKKEILAAIKAGQYTVHVNEPNNIEKKYHPDGSVFYVIVDMDGCRSSTDAGSCEVDVCDVQFVCDLSCGEWSCDEYELAEDEQIIDALESRKDVLCGEMLEPDQQVEVYERATGESCKEYYWYDEDDVPVDADDIPAIADLGFERIELKDGTVVYADTEWGDEDNMLGILETAEPDWYGRYPCVKVIYDDQHEPIGIDTSVTDRYDAVEGNYL